MNTSFIDDAPKNSSVLELVMLGLSKEQKAIPPKLLYDELGSEIFEKICDLPEYYPTRAEKEILGKYAAEMCGMIGEEALIIEPGSGSGEKVRYLLKELKSPRGYVPIEISKEILLRMKDEINLEFPEVPVFAICGDFMKKIDYQLIKEDTGKKVIFFPGSTIGNLSPVEAINFLFQCEEILSPGDGLLIGVDLKKESEVLERAYDDEQGVTADFNLNLLRRCNRELMANFDLNSFEHRAFYNQDVGRIEMHLVSLRDQAVSIKNTLIHFKEGESIHTENSYKYSVDEFAELCAKANFRLFKIWKDAEQKFCVYYFQKGE